jgi:ABC-type multidrug transport system permease subunit
LLALAAAVVAAIGLFCDLIDYSSDLFSFPTFMLLATLLIALHLAGVGGTWRGRGTPR